MPENAASYLVRHAQEPPVVRIDEHGSMVMAFRGDEHRMAFDYEMRTGLAQARESLPQLTSELDALLDRVNPFDLYRRMAVVDRWRRVTMPGDMYYGSDAALQHLAARVVAKPVLTDAAWRSTSHEDVSICDRLLRAIANARQFMLFDEAQPGAGRQGLARGLLLSEHLADRMGGYRQHLRAVFTQILEPLRVDTIREGRFDPLLFFDVVASYQRIVDGRNAPIIKSLFSELPPRPPRDEEQRRAVAQDFTLRLIDKLTPPMDDIASAVAAELSRPHEPIAAIVESLTLRLGTPGTPDPAVNDAVRWRPIIGVDDTHGVWVQPDDCLDETLRWYDTTISDNTELRAKFDKAKQTRSEILTREVLAAVFPPERVHANVFYGDPQQGEADVVVTLPGAILLVEVKGRRFTEPARVGREDRVRRKIDEFIAEPLEQLDRATRSITSSPTTWRTRQRRSVPVRGTERVVKMLVSLENVDPFFSNLTALNHEHRATPSSSEPATEANAGPSADVWAVSITHLMAVAELLTQPAEFLAYAAARQRSAATGSPLAFMETDALAAWMRDRTGTDRPAPTDDPLLDYQSDDINFYFNAVDTRPEINPYKPDSGLPALIGDALNHLLAAGDREWTDAALTLLAIPPSDWKSALRALTEARSPGHRAQREQTRRAKRLAGGWTINGVTITVTRPDVTATKQRAPAALTEPVTSRSLSIVIDATGTISDVRWRTAGT